MNDAHVQSQFLTVLSRDEAAERFESALDFTRSNTERVSLLEALGRVLGEDVRSGIDVTTFDRSNVDGFAVRAADTHGAMEERPVRLTLNDETLSPGVEPTIDVTARTATPIATGGIVPRGADAVVMIEETDVVDDSETGTKRLELRRPVASGGMISFAGTDVSQGETILHRGQTLTSRELGVLAAIGRTSIPVRSRPRVAILSTGDEIIPPGEPLRGGCVYDSNQAILSAAVRETGCEPVPLGIVPDDGPRMRDAIERGLACDALILSGGTSKGAGDLSYRVMKEVANPGIVAHGVALKPGKPICLAAHQGKPVVILPGFPTSAIFTFHEFVAPVLRRLAGTLETARGRLSVRVPMRINSARGRTEYVLALLVHRAETDAVPAYSAYPLGRGSGSVTTFSLADGFLTIDEQTEYLEAGTVTEATLLGESIRPTDLVTIGSHCIGLDRLLGKLRDRGFTAKTLHVGSQGGLVAAKRGECDIAGVHLYDPESRSYNRPFLSDSLTLVPGYRRVQGIVFRSDDARLRDRLPLSTGDRPDEQHLSERLREIAAEEGIRMVNRNAGSGTRMLIDELLGGLRPEGYAVQPKSHSAVVAAIRQRRADWGIAISSVVSSASETDPVLSFVPVRDESYDFLIPTARLDRPAVTAFRELLTAPETQRDLRTLGFEPSG